MRPYYSSGGQTIYHGAAQDVLPLLDVSGVDAVLTDPPYGIDGGRGNVNRKRAKGAYLATEWADTRDYVRTVCVSVIEWCIEHVGRVVVTPGRECLWKYPEPDDIGDLFTPTAVGRGSWGFGVFNPVLYYGGDPHKRKIATGRVMNNGTDNVQHPCPKPLYVWQWLLCKASLEGETVLDPFLGSGTTLVAARATGRQGIGIEIEERYCEVAARRLEQLAFDLPIPDPDPDPDPDPQAPLPLGV